MKKNISRNPLWPDWYNGKKIDEVQFGRAFLDVYKRQVQVRTSTDRTGCTNFFREKNALFTDRGGQAARCLQNPAPVSYTHLLPP